LHCKSTIMYGLRNLSARPACYLNAGHFPHEARTALSAGTINGRGGDA
jgi:hypothetical protein